MSAINHVGLTVTDIDRAVDFYRRVFGLEVALPPTESDGSGRSRAIFGESLGAMKRAVLSDGSGVGIELFEFTEPASERRHDNFEYWKTGIFHVCFTCRDVAEILAAVDGAGGRARTGPLEAGEGRLIAYCEDPFGNIIEVTDRTLPATYGQGRPRPEE